MPRIPVAVSACITLAVFGSACSVLTDDAADSVKTEVVIDARDLAAPAPTTVVEVLGTTQEVTTTLQRLEMVDVPLGLNLRSGPGVEFDVIVGVERNRIVDATGATADGWTEVVVDGVTGWMSSPYLQPTDRLDPGPTTTVADATTTTTASLAGEFVVSGVPAGLNLRSGPGTSHDIVGGAPVGETVLATGERVDGWARVSFDGVTGWVDADHLRLP